MPRKSHPKQELEAALKYAEYRGRVFKQEVLMPGARCIALATPRSVGAVSFVFQASGVRNAGNHAKQIRRVVDYCIWIRGQSRVLRS